MGAEGPGGLVRPGPPAGAEELPSNDPAAPAVGKWYWVQESGEDAEKERWLGCVTHVGSNYAELHGAGPQELILRVHFNEFWRTCEYVPDPDPIIGEKIDEHQQAVRGLMGQVRELTARLAISPGLALPSGNETRALALRTDQPMDEYKVALIKAKEEDLPALFEQIRSHNASLGKWMKAQLIPLKAHADGLRPAMEAIENRIFSVELYAGLTEKVEQVRDGEPAPMTTKIHLVQRRCYMDEECLAQYEAGGMEFRDIEAFDRWLSRKENLERLLPFPRCAVAFRVRRHDKERDWEGIGEYIRMLDDREADKSTFLYVRNGEQLFRLSTAIDFGERLFPDMGQDMLGGKMWVKARGGDVEIISDGRYQQMLEDEKEEERRIRKGPKKDRWRLDHGFFRDSRDYEPFSPESVLYDDAVGHVRDEMNRHNRLVLVLQGLLDRSPVLHPHPPWQLWTGDGFMAALELVYDDARALVAGEKPDFEAYRARLNASLKTGSVTVGQEVAWEVAEARKECERMDRDWRQSRRDWRPDRFRPHGNPGPGTLARVHSFHPKTGTCTYTWNRERQSQTWDKDLPQEIRCTFTAEAGRVLNVDAYKPGDFKRFFNDPRTRTEYLKWAPLMLEAEEYHAGNRKVKVPVPAPVRAATYDGKERYRMRKRRKELMGKAVRLKQDCTMRSGLVHPKGSLWRIVRGAGRKFDLYGILPDGRTEMKDGRVKRFIQELESWHFEIDSSVPPAPENDRARRS